ncbi:MAG: hypothetical protein ABFS56_32345 [Pseudomonadota bacterium]
MLNKPTLVLIIDDNEELCQMLALLIKLEGFEPLVVKRHLR